MDTIGPLPTNRPIGRAHRTIGPALRRIRGALGHRAGLGRAPANDLIRSILADLVDREPASRTWTASTIRGGDPAVVALGVRAAEPAAYLRIARGPTAAAGLARAEAAQTAARSAMGAASAVVPEIVAAGTTAGSRWLLERALPGEPGGTRMPEPAQRSRAVTAVAAAVAPLHAAGRTRTVADADLARWVGNRLRLVSEVADGSAAWSAEAERRLGTALRGRDLRAGWVHGDLWLENARFARGADRVTALVDWDSAAPDELPSQDTVHLAITTRRRAERRDFGPVLVEALEEARSDPGRPITLASLLGQAGGLEADREVLEAPVAPTDLKATDVLLLAWLRFVEVNLDRHPELASDGRWVDANVRTVTAWR